MRLLYGNSLVAEIYRHSSEFLTVAPLQPQVEKVLAAVVQAGSEVVRQGKVSLDTMKALTQDLAPRETLIHLANRFWTEEMEKLAAGASPMVDDDAIDKWA